jgi:hypothetical protein
MHGLLLLSVVIGSDAGLLFATACLTVLMAYELVSGKVIGLHWNVWATRKERPTLYWTAVSLHCFDDSGPEPARNEENNLSR